LEFLTFTVHFYNPYSTLELTAKKISQPKAFSLLYILWQIGEWKKFEVWTIKWKDRMFFWGRKKQAPNPNPSTDEYVILTKEKRVKNENGLSHMSQAISITHIPTPRTHSKKPSQPKNFSLFYILCLGEASKSGRVKQWKSWRVKKF